MTKYTVNGKQVTQAKAEDMVRTIMPKGGIQFIQNAIRNARANKLDGITFHIGQAFVLDVKF